MFFFLSPRLDLLNSNCDFEASPVFLYGLGGGLGQMFFHLGRFNIFWLLKERLGLIWEKKRLKKKKLNCYSFDKCLPSACSGVRNYSHTKESQHSWGLHSGRG